MQRNVARRRTEAVHGDVIDGARHRAKGELALEDGSGHGVVVAGDQSQTVHGTSCVDGEQRVKAAVQGVESGRPRGRSRPHVPDGRTARVPGVIGFADFLGRRHIRTCHRAGEAGETLGAGEVIVPQTNENGLGVRVVVFVSLGDRIAGIRHNFQGVAAGSEGAEIIVEDRSERVAVGGRRECPRIFQCPIDEELNVKRGHNVVRAVVDDGPVEEKGVGRKKSRGIRVRARHRGDDDIIGPARRSIGPEIKRVWRRRGCGLQGSERHNDAASRRPIVPRSFYIQCRAGQQRADLRRGEGRIVRQNQRRDGGGVRGSCRSTKERIEARDAGHAPVGGGEIRLLQHGAAGGRKIAGRNRRAVRIEKDAAWAVRTKSFHRVGGTADEEIRTWRIVDVGGGHAEGVRGARGVVAAHISGGVDRDLGPAGVQMQETAGCRGSLHDDNPLAHVEGGGGFVGVLGAILDVG